MLEEEYEVLPNDGGKIGLDAGLKSLYTTSDSDIYPNPKTLSLHEKRMKRLQRSLSRKKKGSKNSGKARLKLAREHEKVSDISKRHRRWRERSNTDNPLLIRSKKV